MTTNGPGQRPRQGSTYNPETMGALRYDRNRHNRHSVAAGDGDTSTQTSYLANASTVSTASTRSRINSGTGKKKASGNVKGDGSGAGRKRFTSVSSDPSFRALAAQLAAEEESHIVGQPPTRADTLRQESKRNVRRSTNADGHVVHRGGAEDIHGKSSTSSNSNTRGVVGRGDQDDQFIDDVENTVVELLSRSRTQDNEQHHAGGGGDDKNSHSLLGFQNTDSTSPDWSAGPGAQGDTAPVSHVSETNSSVHSAGHNDDAQTVSAAPGVTGSSGSSPRINAANHAKTPPEKAARAGSPLARSGSFRAMYEGGVKSENASPASPRERVSSVGRRESTASLQELWVQLRENRAGGRAESDLASVHSGAGSLLPQDVLDRIKAEEEERARTQKQLNDKLQSLQDMEKRAAREEEERAVHLRKVEQQLRDQSQQRQAQQAREEEALRLAAERARQRQEQETGVLRKQLHATNSELSLVREKMRLEEETLRQQLERERLEKLRLEREVREKDERLGQMSQEVKEKLVRAKKAAKEQFLLKRRLEETSTKLEQTSQDLSNKEMTVAQVKKAQEEERERLRQEKENLLEELRKERDAAEEEKRRLAREQEDLRQRLTVVSQESSRDLNTTKNELELVQAKVEIESDRNKTLTSELNRTQSELEMIRMRAEGLDQDHSRLKNEHTHLTREHQSTKEELNKAIQKQQEQIADLEREHNATRTQAKTLEVQLTEAQAELKAKENMVELLTLKCEKYEETLTKEMEDRSELMDTLMSKTTECDELRAQLVRVNTEVAGERQEKTLLRQDLISTKGSLEEARTSNESLSRQVEDLRSRLETLTQDQKLLDETLQASLQRHDSLSANFVEKEKECTALHELATLLREEAVVKNAEIEALLEKDAQLMTELEQLGKRNIQAEKESKGQTSRVQQLEFEVKQLQETVDREREIRADMEQTFKSRGQETDELTRSNHQLVHRLRSLETQQRAHEEALHDKDEEIKRLKTRVNRTTSQLRVNENKRVELSQRMTEHETRLEELAAQKAKVNETVHEREAQVRALVKKNAALSERLQEESLRVRMMETASHDGVYDMSKEHARMAIEVQQAHGEARLVRAELNDTRQQLASVQEKYTRLRRTIQPLLDDPTLSQRLAVSPQASFTRETPGAYSVGGGDRRQPWAYDDFDGEKSPYSPGARSPYH